VKELLVISQDTSAYGVDLKYRTGFWGAGPLKAHGRSGDGVGELGLGAAPLRVPLSARGRRDPAHGDGRSSPISTFRFSTRAGGS